MIWHQNKCFQLFLKMAGYWITGSFTSFLRSARQLQSLQLHNIMILGSSLHIYYHCTWSSFNSVTAVTICGIIFFRMTICWTLKTYLKEIWFLLLKTIKGVWWHRSVGLFKYVKTNFLYSWILLNFRLTIFLFCLSSYTMGIYT